MLEVINSRALRFSITLEVSENGVCGIFTHFSVRETLSSCLTCLVHLDFLPKKVIKLSRLEKRERQTQFFSLTHHEGKCPFLRQYLQWVGERTSEKDEKFYYASFKSLSNVWESELRQLKNHLFQILSNSKRRCQSEARGMKWGKHTFWLISSSSLPVKLHVMCVRDGNLPEGEWEKRGISLTLSRHLFSWNLRRQAMKGWNLLLHFLLSQQISQKEMMWWDEVKEVSTHSSLKCVRIIWLGQKN